MWYNKIGDSMTNLYLPAAGLLLAIFINMTFFIKKNMNNFETKIFSNMILLNLFESILACFIIMLAYSNISLTVLEILNKVDYIIILFWVWSLFTYIYSIEKKGNITSSKLFKFTVIFNIIITLVILFSSLTIVNKGDLMNSYGIPINILYITSTLYILLTIGIIIFKSKTVKNVKNIPVYILIILCVVMLIIRHVYPQLILLSFILSFIDLLMYQTIENPDVRMIKEIQLAKEYAEKSNRAKSDFLSSMSHEIRTPLNAVVGLSEDISERTNCPDDMKEDLRDIVFASKTLLEIVGNIIDINKIESDKFDIVENPYSCRDEIINLSNLYRSRIHSNKVDYNVYIAEDIPYKLFGDKVHIKQIVSNLLSNSIKYTEEGSIDLNVKCINKNDECVLIISVKDTGRGIKKELINKLFTKFERLDVEKNSTIEGTGLGLAITKKLIEFMNGKINVQSTYGKGSLFVVQIPQKIVSLTNDNFVNTQSKSNENLIDYSNKSVLIVDDNKLNIKIAKKAVEALSFKNIDECYNGLECIGKINNGKNYDLILMDIMMPVMSGAAAIKKLKEQDGFNIPVIAVTADATAGAEQLYKSMGFTQYISKPFTKEEFKNKVDLIFNKTM